MTILKKTILTFASVAFLASAAPALATESSDATSREKMNQEVSEAVEAIKSYSIEQKDAALKDAREMMDKLDARMEELEDSMQDNWAELSESARAKTNESLRALRKQRNELSEWYGSLAQSSEEAWEDVKDGFSQAYAVVRENWQDAKEEFETKE